MNEVLFGDCREIMRRWAKENSNASDMCREVLGGAAMSSQIVRGNAHLTAAQMVARGFTLIDLPIVIFIVGLLVAVGVGWYSYSQCPTIELKKDDWECVKSEQRTSLQPVLVGKTTTLLPMTSTVCVQYNRRAD